jgi:type II secretion system protein C
MQLMHSASSISSALFRLDVGVFPAAIGKQSSPPHPSRHTPRLVSLALTALIAVEILRMVAPLSGGSSAGLPNPTVTAVSANAAAEGVDVSGIVSAHLFGDVRPEGSVQDPANAPLSARGLSLVGTIATHLPAVGMAIIGDQGRFRVYSVGDRIGDASLHLVYLDHVVLDRHGSLELLVLPRGWPGARRSAGPAPGTLTSAAAPSDGTPGAEQPRASIGQVAKSNVEEDASGAVLGIRVVPGEHRSTFIHSGLIGGDVVVAVNGTKLDASDHSQEIWNQVSTGTTVTILRRGQIKDVTLNFGP